MTIDTMTTDLSHVVQALTKCSSLCRSLTTSTEFDIARDHALPDFSKLMRMTNDCAASCDIAILLIERKSRIVMDFLQLCEELTMECAWECSKYGFDICRHCAEACEHVAKACLPFIIQREEI